MERDHTTEQYRSLIDQIREVSPKTILRTMMMTGFPGETEEDFLQTCEYLEGLPVDSFCVLPYSERRFTPSRRLPDKVSVEVAHERAKKLRRIDRVNVLKPFRWLPMRP